VEIEEELGKEKGVEIEKGEIEEGKGVERERRAKLRDRKSTGNSVKVEQVEAGKMGPIAFVGFCFLARRVCHFRF
jgi:hypothetical protein